MRHWPARRARGERLSAGSVPVLQQRDAWRVSRSVKLPQARAMARRRRRFVPSNAQQGRGVVDHALRVATAGGTAAARRAGQNTATWPSIHNSKAPIGR
ncbi:hypothetical protein OZ13_00735 [Xanthomonas cannabis pv. cannabis]|nr:hypothetical protein OZ13_00735 [Xanthomonas cannabis pv. cannabis]